MVSPPGQAREEWTIFRDICAQIGIVPSSSPLIRRLGRFARVVTPALMLDMMLRLGPAGDRFGLRRNGLTRRKLLSRPQGVLVAEAVKTGVLERVVTRPGGRVNLAPPEILAEAQRLLDEARDSAMESYPLRLFGRRELRTLNSWTHNSRRLNPRAVAPALLMHPDDAQQFGLEDGATVLIESATGAVRAGLSITDAVIAGAVCLPHGWGHNGDGKWQHANSAGGANYNALTPSGVGALEPLAAMSILNGVRVRVSTANPASVRHAPAAASQAAPHTSSAP
jgi:formate dehydrogenase